MANEAVLQLKLEEPCPFTVVDGTGIEKGAICLMTDPRTASIATNGAVAVAGIAAREKVASDGKTELSFFRKGWFLVSLSGAATIGNALMVSALATTYPNYVERAALTASGATIIGHALETGTNGERILIELNVGAGGGHLS